MTNDLQQIELHLSHLTNKKITDFAIDAECLEYSGCSFKLDDLKIKYRQAKVTPKKVGLFVTLWKRNNEKQTEPFNVNDAFDFYIIAAKQEDYSGFFIFPKDVLSEKGILTNSKKEGKRGFRVYPDWTKTENNQAIKTKAWQIAYFINCSIVQKILQISLKENSSLKHKEEFFLIEIFTKKSDCANFRQQELPKILRILL